jgi:pilus assembly protein Flp/PilA
VKLMQQLKHWFADERGATAIEYGLIAAAMGLALIPAFDVLSDGTESLFQTTSDQFDNFN